MTRPATVCLLLIATLIAPALADEPQEDTDAVAALMKASRPAFLTLYLHPRRLSGEQKEEIDPATRSLFANHLRREYPLEMTAVVFNEKGWILTRDRLLDMRMIEKIEAEPIGGKRFEVIPLGILRRAPLLVLVPKDPKAVTLTPVKFAPAPKLEFDTKLCSVTSFRTEDELLFGGSMGSKPYVIRRTSGTEALVFRGLFGGSGIAVVGDADGRPIGLLPSGVSPESEQEDFVWTAADLAAQKPYRVEQLAADRKRLAERMNRCTVKLTVTFRTDRSSRGRYLSSSGGNSREQTLFGVAIDPTHLMVLTMLTREKAEKIERIEAEIGDKKLRCTLIGAIKTARAMILKIEGATLPHVLEIVETKTLPWVVPLMSATFREKYGAVDVQVFPDRCHNRMRAFGGVFRYYTLRQRRRAAPALLLDSAGRVLAARLGERPPHETIRRIREYGISRYSGTRSDDSEMVVYTGAELAGMLTTDPGRLDQRIRAVTKDMQHRRPWLGVEISAINKDLAETMDIRKPTRDGKIGLVVSLVYANSPAGKLGLRPTDVLLKVTPAGKPDLEIELKSQFAAYSGGSDYTSDIDFSQIDRSTYARPTWKPRNSFLPRLLDEIGIGEKIEVTWLSGTKQRTRALTIAMAPRDMRSARKAADEDTGLTVKELTYEVRQGYKLAADAAGVLVVKVTSGSPAALARLGVFSIIAKVDGTEVTGPEQFKTLLAAARKAGKSSAKLFVLSPGSSRFADLNLK